MSEVRREGAARWEGESVGAWERQWGVPLFEAHRRLPSTNDRLRELAGAGAPVFSVVVAEEQTAGRGRGGSTWHSPPGTGLWLSVLLPGAGEDGGPPRTPLLVGVAVCRAIRDTLPELEPGIEWPNDVLLDGRKVCGILCETGQGGRIVAGVGINVRGTARDFPPPLRDRATTLEESAGEGVVARARLAGALLREVRRLLDPAPAALEGGLARELGELDLLRGGRVRTEGGIRGRAVGIASDGALRISTPEGERRVMAGRVERAEDGGREGAP